MERKSSKRVLIISALLLSFSSFQAVAQKHDEDKFNQIRSMEDGTWDFSPGWYYFLMHKNYSGAYTKWEWQGFNSGIKIKFDEKKSNKKRVGPSRAAQIPIEILTVEHLKHQIDSIQPIVAEETVRNTERMIDIVYPQYEDEYRQLGNSISEAIIYCQSKNKDWLSKACDKLLLEYDVVCSEIEYIHKQGPENQIETAKRQLAYENAKVKMKKLAKSCSKLARLAYTL